MWYEDLKKEVETKKTLTLPVTVKGLGGWTRKCFMNPSKSKPALNTYVAHKPQALNVQVLNTGFYRVWKDLQSPNYRLKAQIHDSIFAQAKKEMWHEYVDKTVDLMEQKITVESGKTLFIPIDKCSKPGIYWGDLK